MSRPFVVIATPCYGGLVAQGYMESVIQTMIHAAGHGYDLTLAMNGQDSLITRSRNTLVASFLDMPQATHLMFIDADIVFPADAVHRLLAFDQDLVAGMYPIKNIDWPLVQKRASVPDASGNTPALSTELGLNFVGLPNVPEKRENRGGFVTGTYAGTGFMLIKREVFTKMITAYPETKYGSAQTYPRRSHESPNQYALFDCMIEPGTNIYLSEDFAFCRRWQQLGGKIWLDTETKLAHIGTYRFEGSPKVALS